MNVRIVHDRTGQERVVHVDRLILVPLDPDLPVDQSGEEENALVSESNESSDSEINELVSDVVADESVWSISGDAVKSNENPSRLASDAVASNSKDVFSVDVPSARSDDVAQPYEESAMPSSVLIKSTSSSKLNEDEESAMPREIKKRGPHAESARRKMMEEKAALLRHKYVFRNRNRLNAVNEDDEA